jgi:hypothetical protein
LKQKKVITDPNLQYIINKWHLLSNEQRNSIVRISFLGVFKFHITIFWMFTFVLAYACYSLGYSLLCRLLLIVWLATAFVTLYTWQICLPENDKFKLFRSKQ